MCKMKVVLNKLVLGNRELGWELWTGKEVLEMTSKQIKDAIRAGEKICGLMIGSTGELELDEEGFYTTNVTIHSHIGCWKAMKEETISNLLYVCIGSHKEGEKQVYDCISSRYEQVIFPEEDMKAYLKIGLLSGGAKLEGNQIVVASTEPRKGLKKDMEQMESHSVVEKEKTDFEKKVGRPSKK
ncbi:MAG: hypothetical protein OSJ62_04050 [Lachnospiraceae bacterium]|nr:hypothetical protein [Lachnospiraceae bacterium]